MLPSNEALKWSHLEKNACLFETISAPLNKTCIALYDTDLLALHCNKLFYAHMSHN